MNNVLSMNKVWIFDST